MEKRKEEEMLLRAIYLMLRDMQAKAATEDKKEPLLLTPAGAAEVIGVSVDTVRKWITREEDRIPGFFINDDRKGKRYAHYMVFAEAIPEFLRKEATR